RLIVECWMRGDTLQDVSETLNITSERVRQILQNAIDLFRRELDDPPDGNGTSHAEKIAQETTPGLRALLKQKVLLLNFFNDTRKPASLKHITIESGLPYHIVVHFLGGCKSLPPIS